MPVVRTDDHELQVQLNISPSIRTSYQVAERSRQSSVARCKCSSISTSCGCCCCCHLPQAYLLACRPTSDCLPFYLSVHLPVGLFASTVCPPSVNTEQRVDESFHSRWTNRILRSNVGVNQNRWVNKLWQTWVGVNQIGRVWIFDRLESWVGVNQYGRVSNIWPTAVDIIDNRLCMVCKLWPNWVGDKQIDWADKL